MPRRQAGSCPQLGEGGGGEQGEGSSARCLVVSLPSACVLPWTSVLSALGQRRSMATEGEPAAAEGKEQTEDRTEQNRTKGMARTEGPARAI
jgi:hypothetical protein